MRLGCMGRSRCVEALTRLGSKSQSKCLYSCIKITEQVSVFIYYNHLSLRREEEKKAYNDNKQKTTLASATYLYLMHN